MLLLLMANKFNPKDSFITLLKEKVVEEQLKPVENIDRDPGEEIRHTFVMGKNYLEKMRDYAYMRHEGGSYYYGQKDVLHEALDYFFKDKKVPPRPEFIRRIEEDRVKRIKKGLKPKDNG